MEFSNSPATHNRQEVAIGIQEFPSLIGSDDALRYIQNESKLTNKLREKHSPNGHKALNQDVRNVLSNHPKHTTGNNSRLESSKY